MHDIVKKNLYDITAPRRRPLLSRVSPHNLFLWSSFRDGLNGSSPIGDVPVLAVVAGVAGSLISLTVEFRDNIHLPDFTNPTYIGLAMGAAAIGWGVIKYKENSERDAKINAYLKDDLSSYTETLIENAIILKTTQAQVLGRGLHEVGNTLIKKISRENRQCALAVVENGVAPKETLTFDDFKDVLDDYYRYRQLVILAEEGGFLQSGSDAAQHIETFYGHTIERGMKTLTGKDCRFKYAGDLKPVNAVKMLADLKTAEDAYRQKVRDRGPTGTRTRRFAFSHNCFRPA